METVKCPYCGGTNHTSCPTVFSPCGYCGRMFSGNIVEVKEKKLPVFRGYTVDERLQEFRKMEEDKIPEYIPFTSEKGQELLKDFRQTKGRDR